MRTVLISVFFSFIQQFVNDFRVSVHTTLSSNNNNFVIFKKFPTYLALSSFSSYGEDSSTKLKGRT
jgi:hypothetical protein